MYVSSDRHYGDLMRETVHTKHLKNSHSQDQPYLVLLKWWWSHLPCGWGWIADLQRWKGVSFNHHVVQSSRINQECFGLRSAFHEGMTSFMLWFSILLISPPKFFWKIDVISLKERGSFIKFLFHAGMFRVEALPAVWTLDLFLSMMPFSSVLIWVWKPIMLLVFNFRIRRFKFSFWVLLLLFFNL